MKKLTALISLALCLVIGGVYASWAYTGTQVNTAHSAYTITIDEAIQDNAFAGTIAATSTLDFKAINAGGDDSAHEDYYKVQLSYSDSAAVSFKFTPNQGAPAWYANGVPMKITLTIGYATYSNDTTDTSDDIVVLQVKDEFKDASATTGQSKVIINSPAVGAETVDTFNTTDKQLGTYVKVTDGDNFYYVWTITADQILSLVDFCEGQEVRLDTAKKHNLFMGNISNSTMNFNIDAIADPSAN